jgi:phage terminase large subunit-like protein
VRLSALRQTFRAALAFRPWTTPEGISPQREFILAAADHVHRVFQAGNRCGKTTVGAWDVAAAMLGCHPTFRFRPPIDVWGSALDREFGIGQVMWPALKRWLPPEEIQTVAWHRRNPENPMTVILRNGSAIDFKTADGGRTKYQGKRLHLAWVDEEHPADIMEEIQARLLDLGGYLNVTCTPVQRAAWLKELAQRPTTKVVRASMMDAARAGVIDLQAVEAYAASLPERQRRVRVLGDFVALEGAVFPSFAAATHVAKPLGGALWLDGRRLCEWPIRRDRDRPRYGAADFGVGHPMAVGRAFHDGEAGRLIVERVWHGPGTRYSRWAELLNPELSWMAAPMWCDRDASGRLEFEAKGVATAPAFKEVVLGLEVVERFLGPRADGLPGIVLVEDPALVHKELGRCDAKQLAWELEHYHYPEAKDGKPLKADHPVKRDDDCADMLRYLTCGVVAICALSGAQVDDGMARQIKLTS